MEDEAVSIMDTNIEDLTTEDKTKIVIVGAAIVAASAVATLLGVYGWKRFQIWRMTHKVKSVTQPTS